MSRGLRRIVFWTHLAVGLIAGTVIFAMSVTGVLLTFEPQIVEWSERDLWRAAVAADARRRPLAEVVAMAEARQGGEPATTVTLRSAPDSSVRVGFGRDGVWFMSPYTSEAIGAGSRTRDVMHVIEDWHRWLGSREIGRPITGAVNLAFLGLAMSGLYLWWPRTWSRAAVGAVGVIDVRLRGRARDFNWHNSIGLWCAPVLAVLTLTGAVMSYQWANDLLYHLTGNEPPPAARAPGTRAAGPSNPVDGAGSGGSARRRSRDGHIDLDALVARAAGQSPNWVMVSLRIPQRPGGQVTAFIQEPPTWHPRPPSVLTLDARTAAVVRWEPFDDVNAGRKLRALARVLHTGEVGGVPGQIVAGLATTGGAVLVWTGLSLAWRRCRAWSVRRRNRVSDAEPMKPHIASTS